MIKRYELVRKGEDYCFNDRLVLCVNGISMLFELNDASNITLVVSDKKPTDDNNYYHANTRGFIRKVEVFTDFGNDLLEAYMFVGHVVDELGGSCYFWIELP